MMPRMRLVCVLALLIGGVLLPQLLHAEHTRFWRQSDASAFDKGISNGVAIQSDGKLRSAPRFVSFSDPNLGYLWTLASDSGGHLYAGGGSNAKVLRFDESGKPIVVFESGELAAQTIAFDSQGNLYVGTSPDGKVYKVTTSGQKSVFFDPQTKYIWTIAFDSQGDLFVATGDKGQIYVVPPSGKGQLFYQSDQRHARSLAFDAKGNLLIGTEPDGLILRVPIVRKTANAAPDAGPAFVIYETDKKEVTSLIEDKSGNLYAASVGDKTRAPAALPQLPIVPSESSVTSSTPQIQVGTEIQTPTVIQQQPATSFFASAAPPAGGSQVVEIAPDGSPQTLWTSRDELVFAMGLSPEGKPLLGTGDKGTIIELQGSGIFSIVAKTEAKQVTGFTTGPGRKMYVATANPGKVFALGPGYQPNGSFESDTFDARIFSHWGRLTWSGENGATDGKVEFYARSGNTSSPEKNWSPWSGPYKNSAGDEVTCPPARFVQWKAVFLDSEGGSAPSISWVSLAYQPMNVAPVLDDISMQDPGVRVFSYTQQPGASGTAASVPLRSPQSANDVTLASSSASETNARPTHTEVPPQGFVAKGYQSVLWSAHDDNDDELTYTIYYRSEGEQNWRLLKDGVKETHYSWDATTMPDGAYYLKIVASDSPSNPPDEALSGERESERFEVANAPPQIENLRADSEAALIKVTFNGISASGALGRAVYSVDGGDWQVVFPAGLLSDSPEESYEISLPNLPAGEHTVAVQISDRFGNAATAKTTVSVAARGK